jgi:hypothetical protein
MSTRNSNEQKQMTETELSLKTLTAAGALAL